MVAHQTKGMAPVAEFSLMKPALSVRPTVRLKNTSQTSKKFALISRQTLLLTTLFDCTDLNDFYNTFLLLRIQANIFSMMGFS